DQVGDVKRQNGKFIRPRPVRLGGSASVHGPINQQGAANDVLCGNEAPVARVVTVVAVVPEHEVGAFGDNQFVVFHQLLQAQKPFGRDLVAIKAAIGEVVPESVAQRPVEDGVVVVL